jgi:hypothetical protein
MFIDEEVCSKKLKVVSRKLFGGGGGGGGTRTVPIKKDK